MSDFAPGTFVSRAESGRVWHIVESDISNRAITRCGRELLRDAAHPLYTRDSMLVRAILVQCRQCR